MHRTRTPQPSKKLEFRRETIRRLADLSNENLRRVAGGLGRVPSNMTTSGSNDSCNG